MPAARSRPFGPHPRRGHPPAAALPASRPHGTAGRTLGALVLLLGLSGCSTIGGWFTGDNAEKPAPLPEFTPAFQIDTLWSGSLGNGADGKFLKLGPLVLEEKVIVVDAEGEVAAFDRGQGKRLWKVDTELPLSSAAGGDETLIAIGTSAAQVIALNPDDGSELWRAEVTSEVLSAPQLGDDVVVARTVDGRVFGIDAQDGSRRWVYQSPVPVLALRGTSRPLVLGDAVIVGMDNGEMAALSLATGEVAWEAVVAEPSGRTELERMVDVDGDPMVFGRGLFAVAYQGQAVGIDLMSGKVAWGREVSSSAGLSVDQDHVYITDSSSDVWALARRSGESIWKQDALHARELTAPVPMEDAVVVGDLEGYLHWISREDGSLLARARAGSDPIIAKPVVYDDILYVVGADGDVYAMGVSGSGYGQIGEEDEYTTEGYQADDDTSGTAGTGEYGYTGEDTGGYDAAGDSGTYEDSGDGGGVEDTGEYGGETSGSGY